MIKDGKELNNSRRRGGNPNRKRHIDDQKRWADRERAEKIYAEFLKIKREQDTKDEVIKNLPPENPANPPDLGIVVKEAIEAEDVFGRA